MLLPRSCSVFSVFYEQAFAPSPTSLMTSHNPTTSTSPPIATKPTVNSDGDQILAPLFPVAEVEADPEALLVALELDLAVAVELELVIEASTLAIELLAAAAASADDSATNA